MSDASSFVVAGAGSIGCFVGGLLADDEIHKMVATNAARVLGV